MRTSKNKKAFSMIEVAVASFLGIIVIMGVGFLVRSMMKGRNSVFQKGNVQSDLALAVENVLLVGRMAGPTSATNPPAFTGPAFAGNSCRKCRGPVTHAALTDCPTLAAGEVALQCWVDFNVPPGTCATGIPCYPAGQPYIMTQFQWSAANSTLTYSRLEASGGTGNWATKKTFQGITNFALCDDTDMAKQDNSLCPLAAYRVANNPALPDPNTWDSINEVYTNGLNQQCALTQTNKPHIPSCASGTYASTANRFFRFQIVGAATPAEDQNFGSPGTTCQPVPGHPGQYTGCFSATIQSAFYSRNPPTNYTNIAYQWGTLE